MSDFYINFSVYFILDNTNCNLAKSSDVSKNLDQNDNLRDNRGELFEIYQTILFFRY